MDLSLNDLTFLFPEQLFLEFSPEERDQVWQQVQDERYSNTAARLNAYLNRISLNTFFNYLATAPDVQEKPHLGIPDTELPSFWEMVNGTAIYWDQMRLILIPSEELNLTELRVPREWVDIPNWAGNYYLAMQLNLEECWLRVGGYVTYQQLRNPGNYDRLDETYVVDAEDLIEGLSVMEVVEEHYPSQKPTVKPLPQLSSAEAEPLLTELSQKTPYLPRLDLPFTKWAALLANPNWRRDLYYRRVNQSVKQPIKLIQWFQQIFDGGWQTVEDIIDTLAVPEANLAYRSGSRDRVMDVSATTPQAIPALVELLQANPSKSTRLRVVDLLGDIAKGNPEAIAALTSFLDQASDQDSRRQAAVSLGKIDPSHAQAGIRRARIIDLGLRVSGHPVVLTVTLMPEPNYKTNVHLRVDTTDQTYLPPNLKLIVLDEEGNMFRQEESRQADNRIQIEFRCTSGDFFSVKVVLGEASVTEDFVL
jgi:hypothetical protein